MLVYFHGGGWVTANLDVYDASPRALADAAGAVLDEADDAQAFAAAALRAAFAR